MLAARRLRADRNVMLGIGAYTALDKAADTTGADWGRVLRPLVHLLGQLATQAGLAPADDEEPDYSRLAGQPRWGAQVVITWEGLDDPDVGYIMGLPTETDMDLGAIVHIPEPINPGGKDAPDPEWITMCQLLSFPNVIEVRIVDLVQERDEAREALAANLMGLGAHDAEIDRLRSEVAHLRQRDI